MTPDDFKALLEQMESRLSGQLEDLNDANQELIRQLNEREEAPPPMEAPALPASGDDEPMNIYPRWGISQRAIDLFGWIPDEERRIEYMWRYSQIEFARASRHTVLWAGHVTMLLEGLAKDCLPALAVYFSENESGHNSPILQRLFDNPDKQKDYEKAKSGKFAWQKVPHYLQQATRTNSISVIGDMPGKFIVMYTNKWSVIYTSPKGVESKYYYPSEEEAKKNADNIKKYNEPGWKSTIVEQPDVEWCVFEKFQFDQQSSTLNIEENSAQNSFQIQVTSSKATCIFNSGIEAILIRKDDLAGDRPIDVSEIYFYSSSPLVETKRWEKTDEKTGVTYNNYSFRIGDEIANYGHRKQFAINRFPLHEAPFTLKVNENNRGREFLSIKVPSKGTFGKKLTQFPDVKAADSIGIFLSAVKSLNDNGLKPTFKAEALNRIIAIRNDYAHMNVSHLAENKGLFQFFDDHIQPIIEENSRFFKAD